MIDPLVIEFFKSEDSSRLKHWAAGHLKFLDLENARFNKHPLGFVHLKLYETEMEQIRLHLWERAASNQDDRLSIHDHSFNLKSFVLSGAVQNTNYEVRSAYAPTDNRIYKVAYEEERSVLVRTEQFVEIKEHQPQIISVEEFYSVPKGTYHRSAIVSETAISLVYMWGGNQVDSPKVVATGVHSDRIEFKRTKVAGDELGGWADRLRSIL